VVCFDWEKYICSAVHKALWLERGGRYTFECFLYSSFKEGFGYEKAIVIDEHKEVKETLSLWFIARTKAEK
jgi:hypothetical protein